VVVYYCSFDVVADDRAAFDAWFVERVRNCRSGPGCLVYEYSVSPERPGSGILFGAFDTRENFDRHRVSPNHIEMRAFTESRGMKNKWVDYWVDGEHRPTRRPQSQPDVLELVRQRHLVDVGSVTRA
jgi:quinol monooxygenase YgiN